jgi:hypothetical protein
MLKTNIIQINAINPLHYRTVVGFNFDKITNQQYWDKRIIHYYNEIMKTTIHPSFFGLRINVNELNHFMIKLNVKELNLEEINKFYIKSLAIVNVQSFYYEYNTVSYHYEGSKFINIFINKIETPVTPNAFVQANHEMGNILYSYMNQIVRPNNKVIIYGRNSFHIASQIHTKFKDIICINPCIIAYNAGLQLMSQHEYKWDTKLSKEELVTQINNSDGNTTIIMSPGRNGYTLFNKIDLQKMIGKQILYVTCNEKTMRNDIKDNFNIITNIIIELFPGTEYYEHIIELDVK